MKKSVTILQNNWLHKHQVEETNPIYDKLHIVNKISGVESLDFVEKEESSFNEFLHNVSDVISVGKVQNFEDMESSQKREINVMLMGGENSEYLNGYEYSRNGEEFDEVKPADDYTKTENNEKVNFQTPEEFVADIPKQIDSERAWKFKEKTKTCLTHILVQSKFHMCSAMLCICSC